MAEKKRALGRGLRDLLSGGAEWAGRADARLFSCPVSDLSPNPFQPRRMVRDAAFPDLVASVRERGVLQPILATRGENGGYTVIAGERRLEAAREAGLAEVPVVLRDVSPAEALALAVIENVQRRDLNPIEEALAYRRLKDEFSLTQEEVARAVGRERATVANLLRLLSLPPDIQADIAEERLTMGHARALLSLDDPEAARAARDEVVGRGLSVRETEALIAAGRRAAARPPAKRPAPAAPSPVSGLTDALRMRLGVPVAIRERGERGTITLSWSSPEELRRVLTRLGIPKSNIP